MNNNLNTNVGDMPIDIFCDYLTEKLEYEFNVEHILFPIYSINELFNSMFRNYEDSIFIGGNGELYYTNFSIFGIRWNHFNLPVEFYEYGAGPLLKGCQIISPKEIIDMYYDYILNPITGLLMQM